MKHTLINLLLLAAFATLTSAAPILTLTNPNPVGNPGGTVQWTFTLTSDPTKWISVIGSNLTEESNPSLGQYSDNIGLLGGPVNFSLAAGAPTWTGDIAGFYEISPLAFPGAINQAKLTIQYEEYSGDPLSCVDCLLGSSTLSADVSVAVNAVPEPSTILFIPVGLAGLAWTRRKR